MHCGGRDKTAVFDKNDNGLAWWEKYICVEKISLLYENAFSWDDAFKKADQELRNFFCVFSKLLSNSHIIDI